MKLLIVGGVAGGASCAARARRLSEEAEIIMFEKEAFVSFASCGLPYYVGNVIEEEGKLLVATPELFRKRFRIDVRLRHEVVEIDRAKKEVRVKSLEDGKTYAETYDALMLAPGAQPIRPPFPGSDLPGVFTLRTIPDSRAIKAWIDEKKAKRAVIVGAGFIGLEMAENLAALGLQVSLIEMQNQALPPFDAEMTVPIGNHLAARGVSLMLGETLTGLERAKNGALIASTKSGARLETDLALLSVGVRPDTRLAKACGLTIGKLGGISVQDSMQTSDPHIWAAGDAVEVKDFVTGESALIPLAGPANRQGRIAADNIFGKKSSFRGVQATAVCSVFDLTAAMTGANEKTLRRLKRLYEKVYLHPNHHAGYYPGAEILHLKLLFSPEDGRVLGAQAVGRAGVEKRIDVVAVMIQKGGTVYDFEEAELCYAPQYGSAKDPVNMAGMIAANALRGDGPLVHWDGLDLAKDVVLDVRTKAEFEKGHLEGALFIPLDELRGRIHELPKGKMIRVHCAIGQRAYYAVRILRQNGFDARNLSGGFKTYEMFKTISKTKVPAWSPAG